MILSRAKFLRGSVFLIKPIVRGAAVKNIGNKPAKAAISSILGSVSSTSTRDHVVRLPWWCSRGSSCREGRIGNRRFSTSASTNSSGTSDADDASNDEHVEGHSIDRQARWDRMCDALKAYKSIYGDTLVPATYPYNPSLGNWVDNKRQLYRMRLEAEELDKNNPEGNKHSSYHRMLTDEKIEQLNSIDFVWNLYDHSWNAQYEECKLYVAEHGNTLVPSEYPKNIQLGQWVLKQRRNYKIAQKGGKKDISETTLSADRIQKLNDIGFVWAVHEAQWLERLEELKVYIANYGDALVPKSYSGQPFLGKWVDKQRLDYRRYMAKKKMEEEWGDKEILDDEVKKEMENVKRLVTGMTEERIRLLEEEHFIWEPTTYVWESKFEELCSFVALNGHAAIFRRSNGPYDPLARWAEVQRGNYRKYENEQKTTLTEERVERLNALNFVWENLRKPGRGRNVAKRMPRARQESGEK
mmetsp:Transcript_19641/g.34502  ORF Transcript_19641/g.34502 Transcript_19641/m.34502 type:complete len:469 (+) Transcript_19641:111-1517(+)